MSRKMYFFLLIRVYQRPSATSSFIRFDRSFCGDDIHGAGVSVQKRDQAVHRVCGGAVRDGWGVGGTVDHGSTNWFHGVSRDRESCRCNCQSHQSAVFDFIEQKHAEDAPLTEALPDAGIMRLRPVMITVGATVIALFPLASHGGQLWEPMCYAQIGGLSVAT